MSNQKNPGPRGGLLLQLRSFKAAAAGAAAIEFALIAPIMIGLYIMLNETAAGLRAGRKVTMASRIVSDLVTQTTEVTDAYRNDVFNSVTPIMQPFDGTTANIRITSIRFDATGRGYVDWSEARGSGMPAYPRCKRTEPTIPPDPQGPLNVPASLKVPNTSVVLAEVSYKYTPVIGYAITGSINLADQLYTRPRSGSHVSRTGSPATACIL